MTLSANLLGDSRTFYSERSAYVAVCMLFERCLPSSGDLAKLGLGFKSKGRSVFEIDRDRLDRMFIGLQTPIQADSSYQTLARHEVGEKLAYSDLRYCLPCLRGGQHSAVFQHGLVRRCPVHRVDLSTGCPACGARLRTDIETLRVSPFSCNECGHALRQGSSIGFVPKNLPCGPFNALRLKYGYGARPGFEWSRSLMRWHPSTPTARRDPEDADVRRAATRHSNWAATTGSGGISWQTDVHALDQSEEVSEGFSVARTVLGTLLWIRDVIDGEGVDIEAPAGRPWIYVQYSRLHVSLTVAAAAFYRTANLYSMLDIVLTPSRRAEFLLECFGPLPTESAAAEIVVKHEVLGLFARCLGEAARYTHMSDVDWLNGPAPEDFCPAWVFERRHAERTLRIRALVRGGRIAHLVRRLGSRRVCPYKRFDEVDRSEVPPIQMGDRGRSQRARNYPFLRGIKEDSANSGEADRDVGPSVVESGDAC